MAYTRSWDESLPDGSEDANTIETIIQNLKVDIRERMNDLVDDWPNDDPQQPKAGFPRCELTRIGAQLISDSTFEPITWTSEDVDQGGLYSGSGTDITIPTGGDGFYLVTASAQFAANATGAARYIQVQVGGAGVAAGSSSIIDASEVDHLSVSWMGALVATDVITIDVWQDSGGNLNVSQCKVGVVRLA